MQWNKGTGEWKIRTLYSMWLVYFQWND
jgi:hypothetical protein